MKLKTERHLAAGGDAVARAPDGRVVFVSGAAPDEEVRVEIEQDNKRFMRARTVEVLVPSPYRVEPRCRHFEECGGCLLQHVDYATQVKSKQNVLEETLARIGKVALDQVRFDPPWESEPYRYRTRVRFAIDRTGRAGFRAKRSHRVVGVSECPILAAPLERYLLEHQRSEPGEVRAALEGEQVVPERTFGQANEAGNAAMRDYVEDLLDGVEVARALELYGGSGNFTRILADRANRVVMVESDRVACAIARERLPKHVEVLPVDAGDAPSGPFDLLLVDPPRAGLGEAALARIAEASPDRLVYVSCDAATFARDVARLSLPLRRIRLFDLYPQTPHLELVALLGIP